MTGLALGLILLSAAAHAGWNLLLKRSENKEAFVWWILFGGAVMLAPLGGWLLYRYPPPPPGWWLALASAVLHVAYFTLLGRGYSRGDLSLVYPIARGIGPMLVPVLAVLTLGERMALPAIAGVGCIILGIGLVSWWGRLGELLRQPGTLLRDGGIRYAVLTGLTITIYTLVDKRGVGYVQPFLFVYLLTLGAAIGLFPYILRQHGLAGVRREWQAGVWPHSGGGRADVSGLWAGVDGFCPVASELRRAGPGSGHCDWCIIRGFPAEGIFRSGAAAGFGVYCAGVDADCSVALAGDV